jgi:hypothetical protein
MTVDRSYRCDLCHDMHQPDDGKLIGIYWNPGNALVIKPVREVEHHLCRRCVDSVASIRSTTAYSTAT